MVKYTGMPRHDQVQLETLDILLQLLQNDYLGTSSRRLHEPDVMVIRLATSSSHNPVNLQSGLHTLLATIQR